MQDPSVAEPPLKISGDAARYDHRKGNDDYGQVTALFNLFDAGEKARLYLNIAEAMFGIPNEIIERQLGHFHKAHPDYAKGVRDALALMSRIKAAEATQQRLEAAE